MPVIPNQGDSMAGPRLLRVMESAGPPPSGLRGRSRRLSGVLGHLRVMKAEKILETPAKASPLWLVDGVVSVSELCAQLQVSTQTIYDLPSQGRGPRGFRVGWELRFRISEVEAWLTRLESEDERRHQLRRR
jgi:excisionase family DNA binding protein